MYRFWNNVWRWWSHYGCLSQAKHSCRCELWIRLGKNTCRNNALLHHDEKTWGTKKTSAFDLEFFSDLQKMLFIFLQTCFLVHIFITIWSTFFPVGRNTINGLHPVLQSNKLVYWTRVCENTRVSSMCLIAGI